MSQRWIVSKKPFTFGIELNVSMDVSVPSIIAGDKFVILLRDAAAATMDNVTLSDILYAVELDAVAVFSGTTSLIIKLTAIGGYALYKNGNVDPFLSGAISGITFSDKRLMNPGFMTANAGTGPVTEPVYTNVIFQTVGVATIPEETYVSVLPGQNLPDFYQAAARNNISAFGESELQETLDEVIASVGENYVSYTGVQALNDGQKTQARNNIAAVGFTDLAAETADIEIDIEKARRKASFKAWMLTYATAGYINAGFAMPSRSITTSGIIQMFHYELDVPVGGLPGFSLVGDGATGFVANSWGFTFGAVGERTYLTLRAFSNTRTFNVAALAVPGVHYLSIGIGRTNANEFTLQIFCDGVHVATIEATTDMDTANPATRFLGGQGGISHFVVPAGPMPLGRLIAETITSVGSGTEIQTAHNAFISGLQHGFTPSVTQSVDAFIVDASSVRVDVPSGTHYLVARRLWPTAQPFAMFPFSTNTNIDTKEARVPQQFVETLGYFFDTIGSDAGDNIVTLTSPSGSIVVYGTPPSSANPLLLVNIISGATSFGIHRAKFTWASGYTIVIRDFNNDPSTSNMVEIQASLFL